MIHFLLEKNLLPDGLIRKGIRNLLAGTLNKEYSLTRGQRREKLSAWIEELKQSSVALQPKIANEQHYEVPTEFFELVLGKHLKYSSGHWANAGATLDVAEEAMFKITVDRAEIKNGDKILELGCGWGSLTLYMAQQFPDSLITAVSNSKTQGEYIRTQASRRGFSNVSVLTEDMNHFETKDLFDRIVSVEMFEHMRNYAELLEKLSRFSKPQGKLFVHIFAHRELSYPYDEKDKKDWIARYFFTGGIMPCADMFYHFCDHFKVLKRWNVPGTHYAKTCRAWLDKMDSFKDRIYPLFQKTYGPSQALKWWVYWRIFFMACEELFAYHNGEEWLVSHTLLEKR